MNTDCIRWWSDFVAIRVCTCILTKFIYIMLLIINKIIILVFPIVHYICYDLGIPEQGTQVLTCQESGVHTPLE